MGQIWGNKEDPALYNALASLKTTDECRDFLYDLCTPREIDALHERWLIVRLLDMGDMSYREISAHTGASTTTIGRVARFLTQEVHHGYRMVLDRMKKKNKQKSS